MCSTLPSFSTLHQQIAVGGLSSVLTELSKLKAQPDVAEPAAAEHDVLRAAAHVVSADPSQVAGQMLGRLRSNDNPYLARLLADAEAWRGAAWLRPLRPTLSGAGAPLIRTIPAQRHAPYTSVELTADGRYALAGTRLSPADYWDVVDGRRLATLSGHTLSVREIALTADGGLATSYSLDGTTRVWNPQTGTLLVTIHSHTSNVGNGSHALSPDGRSVLVGDDDGVLTLYATADGAIICRFDGHPDIGDFADFLQRWRNRSPGHPVTSAPSYTALVFTHDCQRIVSATTAGTVCVWDVASGTIVRRWRGVAMTTSMALLPDDGYLVCATSEGTIALYDTHSAALLQRIQAHRGWMYHIAAAGDGRTIGTCAEDTALRLWSFDGERLHPRGTLTSEYTYAIALDVHGERMVSATSEGPLRVWDPALIPPGGEIVVSAPMEAATASASWICTVSGASPNQLLLSDPATGERLAELGRHRSPIQVLVRSSDGRYLAAGDEKGTITVWTPADARSYGTIRTKEPVYGLAISGDGGTLLSWTEGTTLSVWDVQRGKRRHVIKNYNDQIESADISSDGQVIAAIIDGYLLMVWEDQGRNERHAFEHYDEYISVVRMSPEGRTLLAGTNDGKLLIWDVERGILLTTLDGHERGITDIDFGAAGSRALSTSADSTVCLWDLQGQTRIASFTADNPLLSGAMSENGTGCIVVDSGGQSHQLQLEGL